jgi:hypothetical protein
MFDAKNTSFPDSKSIDFRAASLPPWKGKALLRKVNRLLIDDRTEEALKTVEKTFKNPRILPQDFTIQLARAYFVSSLYKGNLEEAKQIALSLSILVPENRSYERFIDEASWIKPVSENGRKAAKSKDILKDFLTLEQCKALKKITEFDISVLSRTKNGIKQVIIILGELHAHTKEGAEQGLNFIGTFPVSAVESVGTIKGLVSRFVFSIGYKLMRFLNTRLIMNDLGLNEDSLIDCAIKNKLPLLKLEKGHVISAEEKREMLKLFTQAPLYFTLFLLLKYIGKAGSLSDILDHIAKKEDKKSGLITNRNSTMTGNINDYMDQGLKRLPVLCGMRHVKDLVRQLKSSGDWQEVYSRDNLTSFINQKKFELRLKQSPKNRR